MNELAHKIETKQMVIMFDHPASDVEILLSNSPNVSVELRNIYHALTTNPVEYYSVIPTGAPTISQLASILIRPFNDLTDARIKFLYSGQLEKCKTSFP